MRDFHAWVCPLERRLGHRQQARAPEAGGECCTKLAGRRVAGSGSACAGDNPVEAKFFELAGVSEPLARDAIRLAAHKLPVKAKFVARED